MDDLPSHWPLRYKLLAIVLLLLLAGCQQDVTLRHPDQTVECFAIIPASDRPPYNHVLLDKCTGQTWLFVRTDMTEKSEDGFTYAWHRLDQWNSPPVLVTGR